MHYLLPFFLSLSLLACGQGSPEAAAAPPPQETVPTSYVNPAGMTVADRFPPPAGFQRSSYAPERFGFYLQRQPLKPHGSKVMLYNGEEKRNQRAHAAVLDVDVEARDLQQCADAIMRLRAEYLYERQRYDDLHFNFVSGFKAEYARWRKGDRIWVKGNQVGWKAGQGATPGYAAFRRYLTMVFSYAGTASLVHELQPKSKEQIEVGDVLIRGGSPGHAVIVVDKAVSSATGEVLVLLAQSYMPAQDIHVLVNPAQPNGNPWYSVDSDFGATINTAEYTFEDGALRGFRE